MIELGRNVPFPEASRGAAPSFPGVRRRRWSPPTSTFSPRDDKDATTVTPPVDPPESSGTRLLQPLVLVVDDHDDTREGYAEYLRLVGFRTAVADNGVSAIKVARELVPDAILLDYAMPMMDGVQAALWLKRDEATRRIPIVMLTAFRDVVDQRGGCAAYLEKPCDPQSVAEEVWRVLRGRA